MKVLVTLSLLVSAQAWATSNFVCEKFIACGVYQSDQQKDGRTVIREASLSPVGHSKVKLVFATIDGSSRSGGLAQILSFRSDGSYVIYGDDGARAVGMCGNSACTMSGAPSQYNGEWIEQLAVFKFLGNSLEFHKIYIDGQGQNHTSTVTFTKR